MKKSPHHRRIIFLSLFLAAISSHANGQITREPLPRTFVLWNSTAIGEDSVDQLSFESAFSTLGFMPERISPGEFSDGEFDTTTVLIVPHGTARLLRSSEVAKILAGVEAGMSLVTDGESSLSRALGIKLGTPTSVAKIVDHFRPELKPSWADRPAVPWISGLSATTASVAYSDVPTRKPLAIIKRRGKGRCLYFAPLFDPLSGKGYSRFASLPTAVIKGLGDIPRFIRQGTDAYFDPGYRFGMSPDSLARMWRKMGIRAVHAAAWYFHEKEQYDYRRLIEAAHSNGVLVYAWLEWPYIGRRFWDDHPGWRQKNVLLKDARLDFLFLMDLQNRACLEAAIEGLKVQLALDWDGVDVAEFSMTGGVAQALEGPARPDYFMGFTDVSRAEFKRQTGFDPLELFDERSSHYWKQDSVGLHAFYRYRTEVNNATLRRVFSEIHKLKTDGHRPWELILTIIDNSGHPEFFDLLGYDERSTLALTQEFGIVLHIEDPGEEWTKPPDRYRKMGEHYYRLLGDRPFMIDINVVPIHPPEQVGFSTEQAAGTEFLQQWQEAASQTPRVCIYCEASVYEDDWRYLPYTMAAGTRAQRRDSAYIIAAPNTVQLQDFPAGMRPLMDGQPWPCWGDGGVVIPRGTHRLKLAEDFDGRARGMIRLLSISDELVSCRQDWNGLELEYVSPARCALTFSSRPGRILIDGNAVETGMGSREGCFVVLAPLGRHTIRVFNPQ